MKVQLTSGTAIFLIFTSLLHPSAALGAPSDLIEGEDEVLTAPAGDLTVSLPPGAEVTVEQLSDESIRATTTIRQPTDSHEFVYEIGSGFLPVESQGKYWTVGFDANGEFQAYEVQPAWAIDANGDDVPTHYEIRGNQLVQVVIPSSSTAYPITADPTWQWYSAAYGAGFSKTETRDLSAWGAIAGFCAALPGQFGIGCAVAGAQWFAQAQLAANENQCVFIAVAPAPLAMRWISPECA